ncbi:MAG: hypothetical protein V1798_10890 [Pseudomonadota bacterium]
MKAPITFIGGLAFLLAGCGSSDAPFFILQAPVDIQASSKDIQFNSRTTRVLYVANQVGGTISVLDQQQERFVDTDTGDDYANSPIAMGGEPSALYVQDRDPAPRVFAADAEHRELWAFDAIPPSDPALNELPHQAVDLGATAVGRNSKPLLQDVGRRSSPNLAQVSVDPALAQSEQWQVRFSEDGANYVVTGSKSGRQTGRATEGKPYATDNGAVSFTITTGGDPTTDGDTFRLGTVVGKPLPLTGRPVDLKSDGSSLFIVMADPPSVAVFDLASLSLSAPVDLADTSGVTPLPGRSAFVNGHLFIPNSAAADAFDVDTTASPTLSVTVLATNIKSFSAAADGVTNFLYLFSPGTRQMARFDLSSSAVASPIRLTDMGRTLVPYTFNGAPFGLIPTISGPLDLLDLTSQQRVDVNPTGRVPQSLALGVQFSDTGPPSTPDLLSIDTVDGVTQAERWQLIYEGVVPGTSLAATVSADQLTSATATFLSSGVQAGDHVILDPTGSPEEVAITAVASDQTLQLEAQPAHQGSVDIEVRVSGSYLALGSESGAQTRRAFEGTPYTSDSGAIALAIRSSLPNPTTRDDYFTFVTTDGIDPILNGANRWPSAVAVITRPGDTRLTAYVANTNTNGISVIDLSRPDPQLRKLIR